MDQQTDCRRAVRDKNYKYIRNYMPEIGAYLDISFRLAMPTMREMIRLRDEGKLNEDQMYWFRTKKEIEELYDLEKDPYELNNRASDPDYAEILERMRGVHEQWMKDIKDPGPIPEKELVYSMWPGGIQPVTENPVIRIENGLVSLSCPTEGASIAYQINGKGYNEKHTFLYTEPFAINENDIVTARAFRIGYKPSDYEGIEEF
jgi:hypothetical protein